MFCDFMLSSCHTCGVGINARLDRRWDESRRGSGVDEQGFGRRLREQRQRSGMSQSELGGGDVSASYVSLLESGRRTPTREVLERLAERLGVEPDELATGLPTQALRKAQMDLSFARLVLGQGDAVQARDLAKALLAGGAFAADKVRLFEGRLVLAESLERTGDLAGALRQLEALRSEAQQAPDELPWLPVVVAMSRCYREAGDLHRSVDVAELALEVCDSLGLAGLAGHSKLVATLAAAHHDRGDLFRAEQLLDQLLQETVGRDRQEQAVAYWNAALVASARGRHAEAQRLAEQAAARISEGDDARSLARLRTTRAYIMLARQPPAAAAAKALLEECLPELRLHDSVGAVASAQVELARCEALMGKPDAARRLAEDALRNLGPDSSLEIARGRAVLGEALWALGDEAGASRSLAAAAELLGSLGASRQAAAEWRRLADAHLRAGDSAAAAAAYAAALDAAGLPGAVHARMGAAMTADR